MRCDVIECSETNPCEGLSRHAHFRNFGIAFLTLFRVATGDNWNGIMKVCLRLHCIDELAYCFRYIIPLHGIAVTRYSSLCCDLCLRFSDLRGIVNLRYKNELID